MLTRLLATGLIRYRVRGRGAVTARVMTLAMSCASDPSRASGPLVAREKETPTAAL